MMLCGRRHTASASFTMIYEERLAEFLKGLIKGRFILQSFRLGDEVELRRGLEDFANLLLGEAF